MTLLTCPRATCAELNRPDAIECESCGTLLLDSETVAALGKFGRRTGGALRDHACECTRRSCRERVYLTVAEYADAAARGRVVLLEHIDAPILEQHPRFGYAIVDVRTKTRRR